MRLKLSLTIVLFALAHRVQAQEFRATVSGRVTDPSQAVLPGATVTIQRLETNETVVVTSNREGNYFAPFLKPGTYTITIESSGFKKYVRAAQPLQVNQTATINVQLEMGGTTEEVSVVSDATLLSAGKADQGTVIENRRVTELPLNARNPFMLSVLVAGVNYNGAAVFQRPFDNGAIAAWSINGGRTANNEFLMDGAPNNSVQGGNNIAYVPPVDAVEEFKIMTNSYDAQYGRTAGGVINVSLKSGTNKIHGTVYEFFRRNWLDANTLIGNARGVERSGHYLDQYGVSLDGPLVLPGYDGKGKTFFLMTYEGYREGTPNPAVRSVPPEAFRRGDFSNYRDANGNLITIYDPATGRQVGNQWVRDPFPGNIIPENRINPIARQLLGFYPAPDTSTPGSVSWLDNLNHFPNKATDSFRNFVGKIDHNFSTKDRVFAYYAHNRRLEMRNTNGILSGPAQDGVLPLRRINHRGVVDWVHLTRSSMVFNLRFAAYRYYEFQGVDAATGFDSTSVGFPRELVGQLPRKVFPRINVTDFLPLGHDGAAPGTFREPTNVFSLQPNVAFVSGRHTVRTGVDARLTQYSRQLEGNAGMILEFSRGYTQQNFDRGDASSGSAVASMLLGAPATGRVDLNAAPLYRWFYVAPWIQDDWKLTPRLTLNLGLRWDFNTPVRERHNRVNYAFDTTTVNPVSARIDKARFPGYEVRGGVTFAGVNGNPTTSWKFDKNNFQPRVGLTFELNAKTLLSAGAGKYYTNPTAVSRNEGFSIETPLVASLDGGRVPIANNLANPFPNGISAAPGSQLGLLTALGRGINYSNPDFEIPYVYNFHVGIQRELPAKIVANLRYVGSRTHREGTNFGGINEPPLALRNQCDALKGGNAAVCNELRPNPFFGVPGFEGTARYTSPTLSRFDLARPFPQFGAITENERNDGRIWYNSLQLELNRRFSKGVTVAATHTFSKMIEETGFVDNATRRRIHGPTTNDRRHRLTLSGVWELPFAKNPRGFAAHLASGWQLSGLFIYQSGRPWQLPDLEYVRNAALPSIDTSGSRIAGVQPCVAQLTGGQLRLIPNSVAAGCTEANFVVRPPFGERTTMNFDDAIRRPSYRQLDMIVAKTTRLSERLRLQLRVEAFNVTNSPMYDEVQYNREFTSADFGTINKLTVRQSNFPRQVQLAAKLLF